MRLTRVHVPAGLAAGAVVALPDSAARHVARVLRMQPGDALAVFDGEGREYAATVEAVRRDDVTVRVAAPVAGDVESPLRITLLQGVARGEKMDLVLQKATELGVTAIVPVFMARSSVRLDADGIAKRHAHWLGVVASACEQCGRSHLPRLAPAQPLAAALPGASGLKLLLAPREGSPGLRTLLADPAFAPDAGVALLVGPEGGFEDAEIALAARHGFRDCRLGPRVLRTETAGIAALAALQALAGDLG